MSITREDVLRVAELAHLELSEDEIRTYHEQLDGILAYIDKLKELDVSGVEPMAQILAASEEGSGDSLRDDEVKCDDSGAKILSQAPEASPPWFRVPRVISR